MKKYIIDQSITVSVYFCMVIAVLFVPNVVIKIILEIVILGLTFGLCGKFLLLIPDLLMRTQKQVSVFYERRTMVVNAYFVFKNTYGLEYYFHDRHGQRIKLFYPASADKETADQIPAPLCDRPVTIRYYPLSKTLIDWYME